MTVTRDVTVWCNGCGWWSDAAIGHTAAGARRNAKRTGWAVNLPGVDECPPGHCESLHRPGKLRDLCPDCARDYRAESQSERWWD